jgi:NitT/TauT family transport system permease protein
MSGMVRRLLLPIASAAAFLALWAFAAWIAQSRLLPGPLPVAATMVEAARSGPLLADLAATLRRTVLAFVLAMGLGAALGYLLGRRAVLDRLIDPWIVLLLNLPALVVIILVYVWFGLTETAAVAAVAINKLPNTVVVVREGAKALDPMLDDVARVFRFGRLRRMRHVVLPQLAPYLMAAARSGLSLVWKIVLLVELLGRPDGIGFALSTAFQLFDVKAILANALAFVLVMLVIETLLVQPLERRSHRWRRRPA